MMKAIKIIGNLVYTLLIALLILVVGSVILYKQQNPLGLRAFYVETGSMTPKYPVGAMVLTRQQDRYAVDDVITYRLQGNSDNVVTHRVVEVSEDPDINRVAYRTKGDANEDADPELVNEQRVVGKVIFGVPLVGHVMGFANSQTGFIVLVVIPATLIIYGEIQNIKKEVGKMMKDRRNKQQAKSNETSESKEKSTKSAKSTKSKKGEKKSI